MDSLIKKKKNYLVCVDSDGTVFNSMDIKHKECVIPSIISEWGLQKIEKYVVQTAEYVNLYSEYRGINRFQALVKVFDMLSDLDPVKKLGIEFPQAYSLREWVDSSPILANDKLKATIDMTGDPNLKKVLSWSEMIDKTVKASFDKIRPFPSVVETLEKLSAKADIAIVSTESRKMLSAEWEMYGLLRFVNVIMGREAGSKKEVLNSVKYVGYGIDHILMIGDTPVDMDAAVSNEIAFYPVNSGSETDSWRKLSAEAFDRFLDGRFAGTYQDTLISEFLTFDMNRT